MVPDQCPPGIELDGLVAPPPQTIQAQTAESARQTLRLPSGQIRKRAPPRRFAALRIPPRGGRGKAVAIARLRASANDCPGAFPLAARAGRRSVGAFRPAAASRGRPPSGRPGKHRSGNLAAGRAGAGDAVVAAVRHRAQPAAGPETVARILAACDGRVAGQNSGQPGAIRSRRWPSSSVAGRWSSTILSNSTRRRYGPFFRPPSRKWRGGACWGRRRHWSSGSWAA